jgi:hypothetical protein
VTQYLPNVTKSNCHGFEETKVCKAGPRHMRDGHADRQPGLACLCQEAGFDRNSNHYRSGYRRETVRLPFRENGHRHRPGPDIEIRGQSGNPTLARSPKIISNMAG